MTEISSNPKWISKSVDFIKIEIETVFINDDFQLLIWYGVSREAAQAEWVHWLGFSVAKRVKIYEGVA